MTPDLDRLYQEAIGPYLFSGITTAERPRAILVGGQPGSGKSQLLFRAQESLGGARCAAIVNGDDLRYFHPDFHQLLDRDELAMPSATASVSAAWVERAIDDAIARGVNVVVEGTFRRQAVTALTLTKLLEARYEVDVWAIGLHEWWSRLAIINRYLAMRLELGWGRWSPREAHDGAYAGMVETVVMAQEHPGVAELRIMRRDGTVLFRSLSGSDRREGTGRSPTEALSVERRRTWSETEMMEFITTAQVCRELTVSTNAPEVVCRELELLLAEVREVLDSDLGRGR